MSVKTEKPILQFGTSGQIDKAKEYLTKMLIARIDAEQPEKSTMYIALSLRQFVGGFFGQDGSLRYTGIGAKVGTLVVQQSDLSKAREMWFQVREEILSKVAFSAKGAKIFQEAVRGLLAVEPPVNNSDMELPFDVLEPVIELKEAPKKRGRKPKVATQDVDLIKPDNSEVVGLSTE